MTIIRPIIQTIKALTSQRIVSPATLQTQVGHLRSLIMMGNTFLYIQVNIDKERLGIIVWNAIRIRPTTQISPASLVMEEEIQMMIIVKSMAMNM